MTLADLSQADAIQQGRVWSRQNFGEQFDVIFGVQDVAAGARREKFPYDFDCEEMGERVANALEEEENASFSSLEMGVMLRFRQGVTVTVLP